MGAARGLGVEVTGGGNTPQMEVLPAPRAALHEPLEDSSPLRDMLARARPHEETGGKPSPYLRRAALLADGALIVVILIGSQVHAAGVRESGFFPFGGGEVARIIEFLQVAAWPLFLVAVAGLALNWWSGRQRTREAAHIILAIQVVPAAFMGLGWLAVVALFVVMLALWIALIGVIAALVAGAVATAIAGGGS